MLTPFDWVRLSRTGAELAATLQFLADDPKLPSPGELGLPYSALHMPCRRCWIYAPPADRPGASYCATCQEILTRAGRMGGVSRHSVVLWGYATRTPDSVSIQPERVLGAYIQDEHRFLIILRRRDLKPWLQELMLYHGLDLKGFFQIFPTVGVRSPTMGEILTRIIHHESRFPLDRLRVRFYASFEQIFKPHVYEKEGVLTFDISDFLSTLEMAAVFRTVLRPEEQQVLYKLLQADKEDIGNVEFYWGRMASHFSPEAKDMLNAWGIRRWTEAQINLFYELVEYVSFYQSD